jgi:N-acyl homoserine lactone hydrolase
MGKARGFLPHRWPQWFSPRLFDLDPDPFGPFPASLRVTEAGDVRIVATHGHTRGHVSVVLEEGPRSVFFAGDSSYTEALMVKQAIDGVAPDERAARQTLHRIRELTRERPLVYLPSHDPDAAKRLDARQIVTLNPNREQSGTANRSPETATTGPINAGTMSASGPRSEPTA